MHTNGEVVLIDGSRRRRSAIYIADLTELTDVLGGPSAAVGMFLDAIEHGDQVKIGVTRDRITYENPAQMARYREQAP